MEELRKIISTENGESEIPKWQINEVRKRTENYLKNPNNANDIDDFLKEIESDLNLFK
jgi:hypothetical protein